MGWLEVLALLKRLGPTLTRLVPMLEMFAAARGGSRADAEATDRLTSELVSVSKSHTALAELITGQAGQVATLVNELRQIREADVSDAARLLEVEMQVAALGKAVQQARQLLIVVLLMCLLTLAAVLFGLVRR